jgi:Mg/Co/Ni transporter MgtE
MKVNLRTICENDDVRLASSEMTHDEIRHLIVVDAAGKLVGLVSDRDLLRAHDEIATIGAVMSRDVLCVGPGMPAAFAAERLIRGKYSALPVVDDAGHPIGIITSTDFVDIAYRALSGFDPAAQRVRA